MTQTQLSQPDNLELTAIRPFDFESILEDLDTCGLTPVQFRVYCHLLRSAIDGLVSESSESIAKVCKLTRITVLRVLSQLERMGLLLCDRTIGKKTVYKLQPASSWRCVQPVETKASSNESKVVSFPISATSKPDTPVNEINTYQVNKVYSSTADAGKREADTGKSAPELTLEQKLDAVRQLGCSAGQVWREGQLEILVNGLFMSVESFMQLKLSSFKEILQPCETGLNLCRDAIALIKQKLATAKATGAPVLPSS